ncbi:type IX secretion system membrane protein PorP/SprF [Psychroserpens sp.]|uniref:PorP/SprF family type IX secretion system membrane protein n=1 Tax=Psychroserpens sp. TaxID=2020870 RepID=UPI0039E34061
MKNKYNKIASFVLGIIAIVVSSSQLEAQQDSQYTQYMYNTQTVNPAYAGTRGVFGVTALYRNQWVGLEGAPETLNFSLSTPLGVSERLGIGLSFIQDKAGPASESTIVVDVSYTIPVGERTSLSFGIKGGVNLLNVDYSLLNIFNPNDALQQFNIDNRMSAVAGAGLYLHDVDKWYVGLSVPNFLETTYYDDTSVSNASEKANVYAIAGYVFNVNETTKFKPAVLGKFITGAPIGLDLSANFLFNEKVTLGAAYRLDAAVSALAGFQVSDTLFIGYSYDYGTQELANFNSGSHEIFLRFELGRNRNDRFLSPRFF